MSLETDLYSVCGLLRSIQSHKIGRQADESFAMNLGVMALMFAASYHEEEFRQYWRFVTKQPFPAERLREVAAKVEAARGADTPGSPPAGAPGTAR